MGGPSWASDGETKGEQRAGSEQTVTKVMEVQERKLIRGTQERKTN